MMHLQPAIGEARRSPPKLSDDDPLSALANFRSALRKFTAFSEHIAAEYGLTLQWYQALLVIKTHSKNPISVGELAEQLMIRDHSAAELVTRLAQAKFARRKTDPADRRRSLVIITRAGDKRLTEFAVVYLTKIKEAKNAFHDLFNFV